MLFCVNIDCGITNVSFCVTNWFSSKAIASDLCSVKQALLALKSGNPNTQVVNILTPFNLDKTTQCASGKEWTKHDKDNSVSTGLASAAVGLAFAYRRSKATHISCNILLVIGTT